MQGDDVSDDDLEQARDVGSTDADEAKAMSTGEVRTLDQLLRALAGGPISAMRTPMRLGKLSRLTLLLTLSMVSSLLMVLVNKGTAFQFALGAAAFFVVSTSLTLVLAVFLREFFIQQRSTSLELPRVHTITVIATVPFFLLHALADFLPPMDLIGFACSSLLLVVGLAEQFQLDKKSVAFLIGAIYVCFFLAWSVLQVRSV